MTQLGIKWFVSLVLLCCTVVCNSQEQAASSEQTSNPDTSQTGSSAQQTAIPDTSLSVEMVRWPNAEDLQKLELLKGKGPADVINSIGHPKRLSFDEKGGTKWYYDWPVVCYISMKNDVVDGWLYTAGY